MNKPIHTYGLYKNFTSSNLVYTGKGTIQGVVVNSHTSGTLAFKDALTDTTPIIFNTITFASGPGFYNLFGASFQTGLYIVVGGTIDATVIWNQYVGA